MHGTQTNAEPVTSEMYISVTGTFMPPTSVFAQVKVNEQYL